MPVLRLLTLLLLLAPGAALATSAPVLPADMAHTTNSLQRAVWACEAGAQALTKPGQKDTRFFLSTAAPGTELPLALNNTQLSGFGQISNDRGWFNISFNCALRPDLMQAKRFTFRIESPVKMSDAPPQSHIASLPGGDKIPWSVTATAPAVLAHGSGKNQDFFASCTQGGPMQIRLAHSPDGKKPGDRVITTITDGPNSALYIAQTGSGGPSVSIPAADPLWRWMGKGKSLLINLGSEYVYEVSQANSAQAVAGFLKACR